MISGRCSLLLFFALASFASANHRIVCPEVTCPENNFRFTCLGTLGDIEWIVENANGGEVANYTSYENMTGIVTFGDNNQFTLERVNNNYSSLWFRANPAYNRYMVECVEEDTETCTAEVAGPPPAPVGFNFSIVSRTSVSFTWMRPSYTCNISYYVISARGMNWTINATYTSYNLNVSSGTNTYFPTILARDSAGRDGPQVPSARRCFALDVPRAVVFQTVMYAYPMSGYATVTVPWTVMLGTCLPPNLRYIVTHNGTMDMPGSGSGSDGSVEEIEVPGDVYQVTPSGHFRIGQTYWLTVTPYNRFGAGPTNRIIFTVPPSPIPTPTPSVVPPSRRPGLSAGAIAGIVIGSIVGFILIVLLVVGVIAMIVCCRKDPGHSKPREMTKL